MVNIPVVFCFDSRIILGASVAIKSLLDCAKESTTYEIKIFHSDLSLDNQKNITKLVENTRHSISFYYINPKIFKNAPKSKGSWSEIVYYRLYIPEILQELDKVIYSDVDVLFKGDLAELYETNLGNYEFGAVKAERNHENLIGHNYFKENSNEFIFWSGLMLINCKKFREEKLFNKLLENAEKFFDRLKFFDLDLVNITCDNILPIGLEYCVLQSLYYNDYAKAPEYEFLKDIYTNDEIENSIRNPVIVHYAGKPGKPWRMKKPYSDYQGCLDSLSQKLKKYTFRDLRKKLFSKV